MKTTTRFLLMLVMLVSVGCSGVPATLTDPALLLPTLEIVATRTLPPLLPSSPTPTVTAEPTASPTPVPTATSIPATSNPATSTPAQPTVYHNAFAVGFSSDGSRLVFHAADYGEGDFYERTNDLAYLYETDSGKVSRIGVIGNRAESFSANGRYVLLSGKENALLPLEEHESYKFLVDLQTGQEEWVDFSELNKELNGPTIANLSPDGQKLALMLFADYGEVEIYLQDRVRGDLVKVTEGSGEDYGYRASLYPTFSPDGGWLVFFSSASNLVGGDQACSEEHEDCYDLFVYEISTGQLTRITANLENGIGNPPFRLAVTNGARWIAWADVEETDGQFYNVIRLHDRQTGATDTICGAEAVCSAHTPALSADGRWLAYVANEGQDRVMSQVYLLDRHSGGRSLISADEMGRPGDAQSGTITLQSEGFGSDLQISGDGRFVAFSSQAANLLPDGVEKRQCLDPIMIGEYTCYDLFVFDREAGNLHLISVPER